MGQRLEDWEALAERELKAAPDTVVWNTPEGIAVKPLYTEADLKGAGHLGSLPGLDPFVRGPRATMYAGRPWTIRQYAGFSTAEASNAFYRKALAAGQQGVSVAFDLATHRGYDSDHPRVTGDVGKAGVAVDSVEDMKTLFDGTPLGEVSVSMTMNGAVVPILASFIVAGEEQGVPRAALSGTIQNDILKEFMVRNTYIYPPEPSMRIVSDIIAYTAREMPRFNSISISGYHMQEAGATLVQELAFTLADGREYVRAAVASGLDVDEFAGRLSFFFAIGMNFFMEAAKLRAARLLWTRIETVEARGGMMRAVADGFPKRLIEEAATRRQAAVDKGDEVVVGVNRYRLDREEPIDIRDVDNVAVRTAQVARLKRLRDHRNAGAVEHTLEALTAVARTGAGNILEAAVEAARARATVGEMSDALRSVFGDHAAVPQVVSGIYGQAYGSDPEFTTLTSRLRDYSDRAGRPPRIMIAKLGQDGHDRGAKVIASAFGDIGFDVVTGPLFQLPDEAAEMAVAHQVQVVGISSLAAGHRTLAPELVAALKARGADGIIVIIGGVIPHQDYDFLTQNGIAGVFGPGTNALDAANSVISLLEGRRTN